MSISSLNVVAVGATPEEALTKLGLELGWGTLSNFEMQEPGSCDEWYYRFLADGTSMKAAGEHAPEGVSVTWWK